jgi:hypothetical protein
MHPKAQGIFNINADSVLIRVLRVFGACNHQSSVFGAYFIPKSRPRAPGVRGQRPRSRGAGARLPRQQHPAVMPSLWAYALVGAGRGAVQALWGRIWLVATAKARNRHSPRPRPGSGGLPPPVCAL